MKTVITYGTFDLLHQGHLNLLRRAKELGDYLIVGVTSDTFDRERGKFNVRNNVLERVDAVRATGYADEVIIEDYVGQKIDDILKYNVDIFAIGSDWKGKFDYLKEYTEVVYLPRTAGISSTMLRMESSNEVKVGVVGCGRIAQRFPLESEAVNGLTLTACFDIDRQAMEKYATSFSGVKAFPSYESLLENVDAVYVATPHLEHYDCIKRAIDAGKHVLCETPMVLKRDQAVELFELANNKNVLLMEANKTAYCPAFNHLMVMIKSGVIGDVVDIDASLSQLLDKSGREFDPMQAGGALYEQGSYPLLPILKLMGDEYNELKFYSRMENDVDIYTKGILCYNHTVCSFKVGLGVKTEGDLVISGTNGYAYVPAPWWLTNYFELRFEDQNRNQKFFYKWDGAGLRYEIKDFISNILDRKHYSIGLNSKISVCMAEIMESFSDNNGLAII